MQKVLPELYHPTDNFFWNDDYYTVASWDTKKLLGLHVAQTHISQAAPGIAQYDREYKKRSDGRNNLLNLLRIVSGDWVARYNLAMNRCLLSWELRFVAASFMGSTSTVSAKGLPPRVTARDGYLNSKLYTCTAYCLVKETVWRTTRSPPTKWFGRLSLLL